MRWSEAVDTYSTTRIPPAYIVSGVGGCRQRSRESSVSDIQIRRLHVVSEAEVAGLSEVLIDCVEGGASVSFMWPMTVAKANAFWTKVAAGVARGERILFVAEDAEGIVGTVQVIVDLPENQPHRGDVSKMLVHRRARCKGLGAALLVAAEAAALEAGKTVLVLDTASDSAERLYKRQGWQLCGQIPKYALMPDGTFCATTVFYKLLAGDAREPSYVPGRLARHT